jgi:hypothetical protein
MRKCKYIGKDFKIIDTIIDTVKFGQYFYYDINYSPNNQNPWYIIYLLNHNKEYETITTFSERSFSQLFIDTQNERKQKLKKLNEKF